jgi:hypothetical protein
MLAEKGLKANFWGVLQLNLLSFCGETATTADKW